MRMLNKALQLVLGYLLVPDCLAIGIDLLIS